MSPSLASMAMPVTVPPGRDRLVASFSFTGSSMNDATIGVMGAALIAAWTAGGETATITSGFAAASICATRVSSSPSSPLPQRGRTVRLRPSTKPRRASSGTMTRRSEDVGQSPGVSTASRHTRSSPSAPPGTKRHANKSKARFIRSLRRRGRGATAGSSGRATWRFSG
jgi:hypothetical protein